MTELYYLKNELRWPGIEPGSTAWKAAMLTIIPPTLVCFGENGEPDYLHLFTLHLYIASIIIIINIICTFSSTHDYFIKTVSPKAYITELYGVYIYISSFIYIYMYYVCSKHMEIELNYFLSGLQQYF